MIEVGEYARTYDGIIGKIENYDNGEYWIKHSDDVWKCAEDSILKHSKNIIDLIEVGDIVEVYFPIKKITRKIYVDEYFKDSMILNGIINGNIILKKILTHEQYEQNCYKLN